MLKTKTIVTCRDCSNRHIGCHRECEKYLDARKEYEAMKAVRRREKEIYNYYAHHLKGS